MDEQQRRIEAIRRVKEGESVHSVSQALGRSRRWYYKWAAVYQREGVAGLKDRRGRREAANKTPAWLAELIIETRDRLVQQAHRGQSFVGIGARQVAHELHALQVEPLPHWITVHRHLVQAGRVPTDQAEEPVGYCPRPAAGQVNDVHQVDIWPPVLVGGQKVYFFHLVDIVSWYPFGMVAADKSTNTALAFLLAAFQALGLPLVAQLDNEMSFTGGRWAHRLGRVVRLCLALGVTVWFIPFYTPQRNGFVESFHSQCQHFFWSRQTFGSLAEVQASYPAFLEAYRHDHRLPAIDLRTPAEARAQAARPAHLLPADLTFPRGQRLPIVAGTICCARLADQHGQVEVLNHHLQLGPAFAHHYVLAQIDTATQQLALYYQPEAEAERQLIDCFPFPLSESVVAFDPEFRYRPEP
jgi:transposase InsO family protein